MSKNLWTGIGYLENDPEIGEIGDDNIPYARFILTTVDSWVEDEKRKEQRFYHNIVIWNKLAIEKIIPHLQKDNLLFVQAPFHHRKYEDENNNTCWASEVTWRYDGKIKFLAANYTDVIESLDDLSDLMFPYVNQWSGIGNVGRDPEIGASKAGKPVASFPIATTSTVIVDGKPMEQTDWHKIVVWNEKIIEKVIPHITKGKQLAVQGPIRPRTYVDSSGITRQASEIVLTYDGTISFLGGRSGSSSAPMTHPMASGPHDGADIHERKRSAPNREEGDPGPGFGDLGDDGEDLPF